MIFLIVVLLINMLWIIFQEVRIYYLEEELHEVIVDSINEINKIRKEVNENE